MFAHFQFGMCPKKPGLAGWINTLVDPRRISLAARLLFSAWIDDGPGES